MDLKVGSYSITISPEYTQLIRDWLGTALLGVVHHLHKYDNECLDNIY